MRPIVADESAVSQVAERLPAAEPDLAGSLRVFRLSDVLQMLAFADQTGTLSLEQGWNARSLTFERGRISYIAAATRLPSIEELLLSAGRITPAHLSWAVGQAERTRRSLAAVLVEAGIVDASDLARCQAQQLEETIYTLFLWRNGRFNFRAGEVVRENGLAVDLVSERLIIDGTRRVDEWIAISPTVPSTRLIFRPTAPLAPDHPEPVERTVYAMLDGRRDVVAIAKAGGLTQFDTARALHGLVRAEHVQAIPPDKVKVISLFTYVVESMYVKLVMYGHSDVALQFETELTRFAYDNGLKVRLRAGKIILSDVDTPIEASALVDLYKLFVAVEQNRFARMFSPDVLHGLVGGLYHHVSPDLQDMMRVYEFDRIEGLLPTSSPTGARLASTVGATADPRA